MQNFILRDSGSQITKSICFEVILLNALCHSDLSPVRQGLMMSDIRTFPIILYSDPIVFSRTSKNFFSVLVNKYGIFLYVYGPGVGFNNFTNNPKITATVIAIIKIIINRGITGFLLGLRVFYFRFHLYFG